jgi:hypothetical protein
MEERASDRLWSLDEFVERTSASEETKMDWTVELHPDNGGNAKMIDLPDFDAMLVCIRPAAFNGHDRSAGRRRQMSTNAGSRAPPRERQPAETAIRSYFILDLVIR